MKITLMLAVAGVLSFSVDASDRYKDDIPPMGGDRFMDDGGIGTDRDDKPKKRKFEFEDEIKPSKKSKKSKEKNEDMNFDTKPSKKSGKKSLLDGIKAAKSRLDKLCEKVDSIEDLAQQDEARSLCGSKDPFAGGNDMPRKDEFKDDLPRDKAIGSDMDAPRDDSLDMMNERPKKKGREY